MNLTFSSCLKDNAVFLFRLKFFLLEKHGIDVQGTAQFMTVQLKQRTDQFHLTFMAVKHTGMAVDFLFCFNVAQQRMPGRIYNFIDIFLGNVQNEALFIGIREKGAFGRYREPVLRIEAAAVYFV